MQLHHHLLTALAVYLFLITNLVNLCYLQQNEGYYSIMRFAMNVSLTPELEQFVQEKVKSGRYLSASEVVREALRLLEDRDRIQQIKLETLRKEIRVGVEQIERGEVVDGDAVFAELEADICRIEQAGA